MGWPAVRPPGSRTAMGSGGAAPGMDLGPDVRCASAVAGAKPDPGRPLRRRRPPDRWSRSREVAAPCWRAATTILMAGRWPHRRRRPSRRPPTPADDCLCLDSGDAPVEHGCSCSGVEHRPAGDRGPAHPDHRGGRGPRRPTFGRGPPDQRRRAGGLLRAGPRPPGHDRLIGRPDLAGPVRARLRPLRRAAPHGARPPRRGRRRPAARSGRNELLAGPRHDRGGRHLDGLLPGRRDRQQRERW